MRRCEQHSLGNVYLQICVSTKMNAHLFTITSYIMHNMWLLPVKRLGWSQQVGGLYLPVVRRRSLWLVSLPVKVPYKLGGFRPAHTPEERGPDLCRSQMLYERGGAVPGCPQSWLCCWYRTTDRRDKEDRRTMASVKVTDRSSE